MSANAKKVSIPDLIKNAEDTGALNPVYSNYVRFSTSQNELVMDFYRNMPGKDESSSSALVQRIILPVGMAKSFTSAMVNLILNDEEKLNRVLENQREPQPADKVDIWSLIKSQK